MPRVKFSTKNTKTTPATTSPTLPTSHSVEVKQPGFLSNMFQGFALGTGQSLAFNMFRSDPVIKHEHVHVESKEYQQCMKDRMDEDYCKQYKK
jgi:hypothetical protein